MRITNTGLIALILATILGFTVLLMVFERYFYATPNKLVIRLIVMSIALNVCIFLFIIFSFSKVQLTAGPVGPAGNRGRVGPYGQAANVAGCDKQTMNLQQIKHQNAKKTVVVVQKPILGDPDD
jgi:hypothetical protein